MELKEALEYLMNYFDENMEASENFSNAYYNLITDTIEAIDYDNLVEDIWCDRKGFNHCGCGSPSDCYKPIYDLLDCYVHDRTVSLDDLDWYEQRCKYMEAKLGIRDIYENPLILYLAYDFDRIGLTEHGSSIGGAWITDLGKAVYVILTEYFKNKENN